MDVHEGRDNLMSTVSKFNRSHFEQLKEDFPPALMNKLNRIMIDSIFAAPRVIRNEVPSPEEAYSLIQTRLQFLLSADDDDDRKKEIQDCMIVLEELCDDDNETGEVNAVLSCLYTLSMIRTRTRQKRSKNFRNLKLPYPNSNDSKRDNECHLESSKPSKILRVDSGLYLNSGRFNDINWDLLQGKPDTNCRSKPLKPKKKIPCVDQGLYLNSGRFNDINWDLLHDNSDMDHHQRSDERFNNEFKHKLWDWETNRPIEPLLDDEGFSTPGSNFSERHGEHSDNSDYEILGSTADSELDGQVRSDWEEETLEWRHREPKFISDYDESILHLWKVWNANRLTKDPVPLGLQISFEELKTDVNHLMSGVASNSFWFAPTSKTFHTREMLHLPYLTPEALVSYCVEYLACGNNFEALRDFAMTKPKIKGCGPIHRTFCRCVNSILQMHRYSLLIIKWKNIHTLSLLEAFLSPLRRKLSFTKDLCTMYTDDEDHGKKPGHGVLLLDRLYASLILMETTDLKFLALYFFECCCNIYLKIVSEWLFNGCFSNPANYDEFFVQIQHELEVCWDWRRLSYVRVNEKRIPQCLRKFFTDIFACGKSVNLLRIFTKKEIFERILPKSYPSIRCCFNSTQTDAYTLEWESFHDNFYKKRSWRVRVEDRLIQRYSADFQKVVKETRRKWFEDFEIRQREKNGSSTHISEELNGTDEEPSTVPSSNLDEKLEDVELDSRSAADLLEVDKRNASSEQPSSGAVTGFGNSLLDKTLSSERTDWHGTESESSPAVIVRSSAHVGAGDSATPVRCTSPFKMDRSEFLRNRQNSMSGDGFRQSITSSFLQKDGKFASTPLSACAQNRLKNMSVTFNNEPIESNSDVVTPMSDCERNRLNVMRSEYHERLSNSNLVPSREATDRILFEESECGRNKLKVLSSEYHIRLTALAEQEIAISRKLASENKRKLLERKMKQEEVLFTEEENFVACNSGSTSSLENTIADIVEDTILENEYSIHDGAVSSVSKDQEASSISENQVTIIENVEKASPTEESASAVQSVANGTSINRLRHCKHGNFFPKPANISTSQVLASADSVKDVDITSILYYLPPSISIPLRIQSKLVNEAILWVFIEQEGYLEHLKTLKSYILLGKAEFSLSITNSLFETSEEAKRPSFLLNSYSLNSILQRALSACNCKHLVKFERNLSFVLEDQIPDFFDLTDVQMFRCLSMHYTVKWPVNVLITEPIVKKYSRIFRFLIQLQRVAWVLRTDFRDMKNLKRGKSIQYTQVQLFRHTMTQVIRLLKEYIMREALEQCWNDLVHNFMNAKINLDELYMMHLKYINKIIQRCFLCEDSVVGHKAILHVFGSVLNYHDALRKGSWRRNEEFNLLYNTNFKNVCAAFQEFGKNLDNFRAVLRTLVYEKQKMYFESLLLQLDSNTKNETEL